MNRRTKITLAVLLLIMAAASLSGLPREPEEIEVMATTEEPQTQETMITEEPEPQEPEWIEVEATAYCPCEKCCGKWALNRPDGIVYTASGAIAQEGVTIAADWSVFPVGTVVFVEGYGTRTVQDKGAAVKGNAIDVYFESHEEALVFGRQKVLVYIVEEAK
jgi:3D (Asp-Asp-Asp) domain-containing protein